MTPLRSEVAKRPRTAIVEAVLEYSKVAHRLDELGQDEAIVLAVAALLVRPKADREALIADMWAIDVWLRFAIPLALEEPGRLRAIIEAACFDYLAHATPGGGVDLLRRDAARMCDVAWAFHLGPATGDRYEWMAESLPEEFGPARSVRTLKKLKSRWDIAVLEGLRDPHGEMLCLILTAALPGLFSDAGGPPEALPEPSCTFGLRTRIAAGNGTLT